LDGSITPAEYVSFLNIVNNTQLARFGLHNGTTFASFRRFSFLIPSMKTGKPNDPTLIDGKWESIALAPVNDPAFPDDYFLFTGVRFFSFLPSPNIWC
jgi:hypothetical protein